MSRIRSVKPEYFSSEQALACSRDTRLFFVGLWCHSDDEGRAEVRPRQLKLHIFPGDEDIAEKDIRRMLDELATNGLITIYSIENKEYSQITGWHHQKIGHPTRSKIPGPNGAADNSGELMSPHEHSEELTSPHASRAPADRIEGREGEDRSIDRPTEILQDGRARARAKAAAAGKRPASLASPCRPNGGSAARGPRRQPEIALLPRSDPTAPGPELSQAERQARIAALEELKRELMAGADPWAPKP